MNTEFAYVYTTKNNHTYTVHGCWGVLRIAQKRGGTYIS